MLIDSLESRLTQTICATKVIGKLPGGSIISSFCSQIIDTALNPIVSVVESICASMLLSIESVLGLTNSLNQLITQIVNDVTTAKSTLVNYACGPLVCASQVSGACTIVRSGGNNALSTAVSVVSSLCSSITGCFPSFVMLHLRSGAMIQMKDLRKGDVVMVGPSEYSEVYMFSHRQEQKFAYFIKISTVANHSIWLTPGHYLYANGMLLTADSVKVGDSLTTSDDEDVVVSEIAVEMSVGLYNPHTFQGDIIVNGIKASTYTDAVTPSFAHAALSPARALYSAGFDVIGNALDDEEYHGLLEYLPRGSKTLNV